MLQDKFFFHSKTGECLHQRFSSKRSNIFPEGFDEVTEQQYEAACSMNNVDAADLRQSLEKNPNFKTTVHLTNDGFVKSNETFDITQGLQEAIDQVYAAAEGGEIIIPPRPDGQSWVAMDVNLLSRIKLRGVGWPKIQHKDGVSNFPVVGTRYGSTRIRGSWTLPSLSTSHPSPTKDPLDPIDYRPFAMLDSGNYAVFLNNRWIDTEHAFAPYSHTTNVCIDGIDFDGNKLNNGSPETNPGCVRIKDCYNALITSSSFSNGDHYGLNLDYCEAARVEKCQFHENGAGKLGAALWILRSNRCDVSGCHVKGTTSKYGIIIEDRSTIVQKSLDAPSNYNKVHHNYIEFLSGESINVLVETGRSNEIANNFISTNGIGVYLYQDTIGTPSYVGIVDTRITDNIIRGNTSDSIFNIGIQLTGDIGRTTISGGSISDMQGEKYSVGIRRTPGGGSGANVDNLRVSNVDIFDNQTAIDDQIGDLIVEQGD